MAMLRHKPTGDLYISTPALLARGDMEVVAEEVVAEEVVAEEVVAGEEENKIEAARGKKKAADEDVDLDALLDAHE
jgi:predicted short-subunit dehydrogenase-like oxidoreductase (DUF2520 family)